MGRSDDVGGVYPYAGLWGYPYDPALDRQAGERLPVDEVQEARQQAARLSRESGLDAEPAGEVGDPAQAIVDAAEANDADVIVLGWQHRNWLTKLFADPTSDEVIKRASRPVMVVPDTEAD